MLIVELDGYLVVTWKKGAAQLKINVDTEKDKGANDSIQFTDQVPAQCKKRHTSHPCDLQMRSPLCLDLLRQWRDLQLQPLESRY